MQLMTLKNNHWVIDSGVSQHVSENKFFFQYLRNINYEHIVTILNSKIFNVRLFGDIILTDKITLYDVLYIYIYQIFK